jgi:adenylosuccinate lyase
MSSPSPPRLPKSSAPARWFHYGLTSNDVVDTAQALLIQQARPSSREDLEQLARVLRRRAAEFKHTPMVGRTHGVHAEPITFGFKLANWYSEVERNIERFRRAAEEVRVGKFSGAVGIFAHLTPGDRRENMRAPGFESGRTGILAGDPARPPRAYFLPRWR